MANQSTRKKAAGKIPLTLHRTGQWCKKVRGKLLYFGKDQTAALNRWLDEKDELLAGRRPRERREGLSLVDAVNSFLTAKQNQVTSGELSPRSWNDYKATCAKLLECFGRNRLVDDLQSCDFDKLRLAFGRTRGAVGIGNEVTRTRTFFKYVAEAGLIERPLRFVPTFKKASRKTLRKIRQAAGPKMFTPDEVRALLAVASPQLRAMILLGINCGFGNSDCATLPIDRLDLDRGWHSYGRPKTGIERRCPLWPETAAALRGAIATRPQHKEKADKDLVFITKYGHRFVRLVGTTAHDAVSGEFAKLLASVGIDRPGATFYTLRRTFRTVADASRDQPACNLIMGHSDASMADVYRQGIDNARLQAVVDHVRGWLFAKADDDADNATFDIYERQAGRKLRVVG